jgi:hypothetical protein
MKVIFLDFDGVLNSEASMRMEHRRKNVRAGSTLSALACSNLQYILEQDSSVTIVVSSTWRKTHTRVQLQNILASYGVDGARVVGFTPSLGSNRALEIDLYLADHPNITKFVILDDDQDVLGVQDLRGHVFMTTWEDGLLLKQAKQIAELFRKHDPRAVSKDE